MTSTRLALALAVAALALAGCGGSGNSAGTTSTETTTTETTTTTPATAARKKLDGSVGPGFDISLTQNGQALTTISPGAYTLTVNDQSDAHNFRLTGPGVDVRTDVSTTGTKTFEINLQDGTYDYLCDPHASSMHGSFTVSG